MSGTDRATLEATVVVLEQAYQLARADLERRIADDRVFGLSGPPELVRDAGGRYLLLDALTALVTARAVLAST